MANDIELLKKKTTELNEKIQKLLDEYNSELDSSKYELKIDSKHNYYVIAIINRSNLSEEEKDQIRDFRIAHSNKV